MTSADQVSRLLALVPYLQLHPDAELEATAATFGVSAKQLLSDLKVLWYCGLPGGLPGDLIEIDFDALDERGRIRLSNADYLSRPMRFTPDEALSLLVALRAVRELAGAEAGVDSAVAKLERATGAPALPRVAVAGGEEAVRGQLAQAIQAAVLVGFDYVDAGLEPSTPVVVPARLMVRDGYGYLQAWSPERADWRTYRLDRIANIQPTSTTYVLPGEPPEFGAGWLEASGDAQPVQLTVTHEAAWIAEYIPVQQVRRLADHVEIDLLVADPAWLRSLILRLGDGLLSVQPEAAAESARKAAREALDAYRAG
ncbi:MAG: WYL domain-containing protein [Propionibacteriales bacterium]|nr:WYL domain-containing protein [Propionibacteriales bacterium]